MISWYFQQTFEVCFPDDDTQPLHLQAYQQDFCVKHKSTITYQLKAT